MSDNLSCYDRTARYRPQNAFPQPDGAKDQAFIVGPFPLTIEATGMLSLNLPVQLDDDVPFFIRSIYLGIFNDTAPFALIRIRDCFGNPLMDGLIAVAGWWGNSSTPGGIGGAFGITLEQEVECSPGGTILIDVQFTASGGSAQFTQTTGLGDQLIYTAAIAGAAGNGATIHLVNPGAPNVPLSVAVVGRAVTVTLATDGGGAISSTVGDVQNIINDTPAAAAVMFVLVIGTLTDLVDAVGLTTLTGGFNAGTETLFAALGGVKRFGGCAK